jgi:tripartite ATP-independent transporter DctM subunit
MSAIVSTLELKPAGSGRFSGSWTALHRCENLAISFVLAGIVCLPLIEAVLRRTTHTGIPGSNAILQHLVLILGMLGSAVAAREKRLLALSTLQDTFFRGLVQEWVKVVGAGISGCITVCLGIASYQFILTERLTPRTIANGIPVWFFELAMPIGFAAIAVRILIQSSRRWPMRLIAIAICLALAGFASLLPVRPDHLMIPAILLVLAATASGAPAFSVFGGIALVLFWAMDQPIASISIAHYSLITNPSLASIPLFTLAGYFLAEGGAPRRLIRVFYALFGTLRAGPSITTVVVCMFFTSFTGASGVTILALGGLLMPVLLGARYSEKNALGLITGSGSLGLLLPPCMPLILYAIVAQIPMEQMFLGGVIPALVMGTALAWWGYRKAPKSTEETQTFSLQNARIALWEAKWELLLPFVAIAALFSGLATPVEASAVTALYAFVVEAAIYRDLKISTDAPRVMTECGLLTGGILLILGVALGFTNYLVDAEVPMRAVEWTTHFVHSPIVFLALLNLFLAIVGCLMDIYSAIIIQVPLLVPLGVAFGIDPVHLGIIFLANLELGYLTPPIGLNLYLSSYRFKKPVPEVLRSVLPVIVVILIGVLLITYVPALTTLLPRLIKGQISP